MESLESPPRSAKAMADWLITEFNDPDCPLGSVSLIVSTEDTFQYEHPLSGEIFAVPTGSTTEIVDAVDAWAARAGSNVGNRCIFYFCGHGLHVGGLDFLLSRSFGEKPNQFWDGVLRRSSIDAPMRIIGPENQVFFYDTCRNEGTAIIGGSPEARTVLSTFETTGRIPYQCRMFATAEGASAHGRPQGLSLFAEEFIERAKKTAARKQRGGGWWINTGDLHRHMVRFIKDQRCQLEGDQLDLSYIGQAPTNIPVVLSCEPSETIYSVDIECRAENASALNLRGSMLPDDGEPEWRLSLNTGNHEFSSTACIEGDLPSIQSTVWIESPFTDIVLDIEQGRFK